MKKILLSILVPFAVNASFAQCVPSDDFAGTGLQLSPTVLEPIYACNDCDDYEVVISVQTMADTTLSVELAPGQPPIDVTVFMDFFRLDSIAGLPAGLNYTTDAAFDTTYDAVLNPFGYWINPGDTTNGFEDTSGCISISGLAADWTAAVGGGPNNDGLYPLTVFIDGRAANFDPVAIAGFTGFDVWLTELGVLLDAFGDPNFTVNGIKMEGLVLDVRQSGVGISENENNVNQVVNYPNPFSESTKISFNLNSDVKSLNFEVFNVLGATIHSEVVFPSIGKNSIDFASGGLSEGIYFYTLSDGNNSITKKMSVK